MSTPPLLRVSGLTTAYTTKKQTTTVVDDVSFTIARGETVGVVGESGCGKSTLAKTLVRLLRPSAGSIELNGRDISRLDQREMAPLRSSIQMIFQDPFGSLNPRKRVGDILETPLKVHGMAKRRDRLERIHDVLARVGFPPSVLERFPHEFSGGQRQRIGIARALVLRPQLVICDEPVSALDLSIQAQVLNLLVDLKRDLGLSYLFISHDLSVVKYISDHVLVMLQGKIVEAGPTRQVWENPSHAYTKSLVRMTDAAPAS